MMFFPRDLVLEDERVLLRPLQETDREFLVPFALNEPNLWPYSLSFLAGEKEMTEYINYTIAQREAQREYPFIIFDKKANSYAGSTRFYDIQLNNLTTQL